MEEVKSYRLHCDSCKWTMYCDGSDESFSGLYEYKACQNCHGARTFRCNNCGFQVRAKRVMEATPAPKMNKPKPIGYVRGVTEHRPTGRVDF